MTDKLYLLQITMLAKLGGVKILRFQLVLALPSSEAPKVYLTWRSCLACRDSTMDVSTHTGDTGHTSMFTCNSAFQWLRGRRKSPGSQEGITQSTCTTAAAQSSHAALAGGSTTSGCRGTHSTTAATRAGNQIYNLPGISPAQSRFSK